MMGATSGADQNQENVKPKRRIRNFLLDKRFQLGWVLRVVLAVSIIVSIMGYFLYDTVSDATDQMLVEVQDPAMTAIAWDLFREQAQADKAKTMWALIAWLVSIVVVLGVLTIISTHKIAGPVYKMRRLFSEIDGRNLQLWAKLRKSDELQEAFIDFDNMIRRIRENRREDIELLKEIHALIEHDENQRAAAEKLGALIASHEKSVKMD
jgi:hypothetical protein